MTAFFALIGRDILGRCVIAGRALMMLVQALGYIRLIYRSVPQLIRQIAEAGFGSIMVLSLIAGLTGMIMAVQTGSELKRFGVLENLGAIIGATFFREMGPIWAAVIVLARVGASMAAELGTMAVNEEVDALRAMSINPVRYLVMPRILALMILMPILTAIADAVGMVGGAFVSKSMFDVPISTFMDSAKNMLTGLDFSSGLFKGFVFGAIIGTIACDQGMNTTDGAEGVGRSTTNSVVLSIVFVLLMDLILTSFIQTLIKPLMHEL